MTRALLLAALLLACGPAERGSSSPTTSAPAAEPGTSPSRLRTSPPDVRPTLVQLERIEDRILTHELTTARWRGLR